jgi:hypothetical protein
VHPLRAAPAAQQVVVDAVAHLAAGHDRPPARRPAHARPAWRGRCDCHRLCDSLEPVGNSFGQLIDCANKQHTYYTCRTRRRPVHYE